MKKYYLLNVLPITCLLTIICMVCYILRQDDILPLSIFSVWSYAHQWHGHFHVLAVGLLPIYVALMIFGAAVLGFYFSAALKRLLMKLLNQK